MSCLQISLKRKQQIISVAGILVGFISFLINASSAKASVIFQDDFNSGASPLWGNELGNWSASGGVYNSLAPNNNPLTYSSLPFNLTDFAIDVDINKVVDGGIFFRSSGDTPNTRSGVLLVTGGLGNAGTGLYWHILKDGDAGAILNPSESGLFESGVSNINLRVAVQGNTYSAFLNGSTTPITTLTTDQFSSGRVALYDFSIFDESAQTFDNVKITSFDQSSVPEPTSALGLLAFGVFGAGFLLKRKQPASGSSLN
jgi:PEP-CTERM motif